MQGRRGEGVAGKSTDAEAYGLGWMSIPENKKENGVIIQQGKWYQNKGDERNGAVEGRSVTRR